MFPLLLLSPRLARRRESGSSLAVGGGWRREHLWEDATLTFLTPVGPNHIQYLPACIATVKEQTIPCQHLITHDTDGSGPAVIRNQLLAQASTDYVAFLDADDWVEPDFAERMLTAVQHASYAYSDWYQDGQVQQAPERAWCAGTFHLVTAVVPRRLAVQVGGFDTGLEALEDTDFWLKFISRGWCGARVPYPLVHYRAHGGRSDAIHAHPERLQQLRSEINQRYRDNQMGCCGDPSPLDNSPVGEQRDGDVLAMALWGGNRTEHGRATGRRYPRTSYPHTTWVDPRDVRAAPHLWKPVTPDEQKSSVPIIEPSPLPAPRGIDAIRAGLAGWGTVEEAGVAPAPQLVAPIPNTAKVRRLAGDLKLPVFVAPRKTYQSYADFWQLVRLAGFELIYQGEPNLDDETQTYIFASPDGPPDCSHARARTIFWQLEYTGDYTNQPNLDTVSEVWSSDPEHARSTGARFVLMGSHPGLNPTPTAERVPEYDLTMLAYMTPRRQAIKEALSDYRWTPDYPGHDGQRRHDTLMATRLMLHVHQHDAPAVTPLRFALAAAYRLPVIAERVVDGKPYKKTITWANYDKLAARVEKFLQGGDKNGMGNELYELLCVQHPFGENVLEALKS